MARAHRPRAGHQSPDHVGDLRRVSPQVRAAGCGAAGPENLPTTPADRQLTVESPGQGLEQLRLYPLGVRPETRPHLLNPESRCAAVRARADARAICPSKTPPQAGRNTPAEGLLGRPAQAALRFLPWNLPNFSCSGTFGPALDCRMPSRWEGRPIPGTCCLQGRRGRAVKSVMSRKACRKGDL
jgi:hypothetical protein